MRRVACAAALVAAGVPALVGCSGGGEDEARTDPPRRYEADGVVVQGRGAEPMLCLTGAGASIPPACGTVELAGWRWQAVAGEERLGGATWGEYHVEGTFDGETLTVTAAGPPERAPAELDGEPAASACDDPAGGRTGPRAALDRAALYAETRPEYVAAWMTRAPGDEPVLNAVFTAGGARYEEALRERWPGLLCVVERDALTEDEAERRRANAVTILDGLGLEVVSSAADPLSGAVEVEVVVDAGGLGQSAVDDGLGPGAVAVVPALEPVE
jgi:hypothetical protein